MLVKTNPMHYNIFFILHVETLVRLGNKKKDIYSVRVLLSTSSHIFVNDGTTGGFARVCRCCP